ncbi:lysine--tRNA ligase (plasmid) [Pseudoalteromonas luteoviolacea]|nr:lysine--tRNA ligase [Pseudoalteromonas luteoviolacea]
MNDIEEALSLQTAQIVNDSKTPSGQVHVGSLRGVLIHDAVTRHLKNDGFNVQFTYGIDDYDPMDGLPHDASDELKNHMGKPLCNIPPPNNSSATDFADHYISDFLEIFDELGVEANIYRMRDMYRSGKFNHAIEIILKNAQTVRDIYRDVSGSVRPSDWYPFQVICENCGKIGTTEVYDYENGEVSYRCRRDLVSWAEGCSHQGRMSPFNGNGKLPWKLEWAAKWFIFGITVEGAGKDHCTKGGSREIACQVLRKVFDKEPPLNIPYEFFLVKGAKMSSSKGVGASARSMVDFLPPEVLRYLMVKSQPKRAVNFSTDLNPMLRTFNEYDSLIRAKQSGLLNDEQKQLMRVVEVSTEPKNFQPVSFQLLVSMLQLPHIEISDEVSRRAGKELSDSDTLHLKRRILAAEYWLKHYASEADRYELQDEIPNSWIELSEVQKLFLSKLLTSIENTEWYEEHLQSSIFDAARCTPISPKLAFASIYKVFLDKDSGPKAGALISYLDRKFVADRLSEVYIADWFSCYDELGESISEFMNSVDEIKQHIEDVMLTPELPFDTKSGKVFDSKSGNFIRVNYTHKEKIFSRLLKLELKNHKEIEDQKCALIDSMTIIASDLRERYGICALIDEA